MDKHQPYPLIGLNSSRLQIVMTSLVDRNILIYLTPASCFSFDKILME